MATAAPAVRREWQRFTAGQRLARYTVYLLIVAAIVASLRTIEVISTHGRNGAYRREARGQQSLPVLGDMVAQAGHDQDSGLAHIHGQAAFCRVPSVLETRFGAKPFWASVSSTVS